MADVLIRGLDDDVVRAVDVIARRMGVSRNEYLKRSLTSVAHAARGPVSSEDFAWVADTFPDLADEEAMDALWR